MKGRIELVSDFCRHFTTRFVDVAIIFLLFFCQAELDHFVCHQDLFSQMRVLTGMLRDKTPKQLDGTVGSDVAKMVRTFRSGMVVQV